MANTAATASIKDDTLATPPFSFILEPMSIVITVPIMLQGPLMKVPAKKIVMQQGQTSSPKAKEIRNMIIAHRKRQGLRKMAFLLKQSDMKPTLKAPTTAPTSNIADMYPFWSEIGPVCSSSMLGSQKRSPQMQPLRQAQEKTQQGTLGMKRAEIIPYLKVLGLSSYPSASIAITAESLASSSWISFVSSSIREFQKFQQSLTYGFSLRKRKRINATRRPIPPVRTKFHTRLTPLSSKTLSSAEAMISPILALHDQMPIRSPFLCPTNQLLKIPIIPGHPVAWKNPLIIIRIVIKTTLQNPVAAQRTVQSIQLTLAVVRPITTYVFRDIL